MAEMIIDFLIFILENVICMIVFMPILFWYRNKCEDNYYYWLLVERFEAQEVVEK